MNPLATAEIGRLEQLAEDLANPTDLDDVVHTTRKGIKRLRAFLRLARRSVGTSTYRTENAALRDTARLLAPVRDTYVLIDTARALGAPDGIVIALREHYAGAVVALEAGSRSDAVRRLETISRRWSSLEWHGPDSRSIGAGLLRTYRRGLVDFETVDATPSADAFHSWRRRVKYLRYQLELLHTPQTFLAPYTALGDDLGLEHDQTVLLDVCDSHTDREDYASLAVRCAKQREDLRSSALDRGTSLFDQEPESFLRTVEGLIELR